MNKFRLFAMQILLVAISFVFVALAAEVGLRAYQKLVYGADFWAGLQQNLPPRMSPIVLERNLGWVSTPDADYSNVAKDIDGTVNKINFTTNNLGFRTYGELDTDRPKILVIGDSYTQAVNVSDAKTYHARLGTLLDAEVFAYGARGYGTLQEFMIIDRYIDELMPDLIILQSCPNDFINNSLELEVASRTSNNGMVRPYWIDGKVEYYLPKRLPRLRKFAINYSRLLYFILTRWDMINARYATPESQAPYSEAHGDPKAVERATGVTRILLKMIKERAGKTPVVAFTSGMRAADKKFSVISKSAGVDYISGVGMAVRKAEARGKTVRLMDGHWNSTGHRIVAGELGGYITRNRLLVRRNEITGRE